MTTVTSATSSAASNPLLTAGTDSATKAKETQTDRFLKLLVTQMQNQDPLNPLDNAEVTSQIAQISTVEGIDKLNKSMTSMSEGMLASQSVQASSMLGKSVLAEGSRIELLNGSAMGGAELSGAASKMVVTIVDQTGVAIDAIDMGEQPAGVNTFQWDGKRADGTDAPQGTYGFKVDAWQADGSKVTVNTLGVARVNSVSLDGGVTLNTAGLGAIPLNQVKQIF